MKVIEDGKEVETFVIASKDIVENENGLIISLESFNQVNKQKYLNAFVNMLYQY